MTVLLENINLTENEERIITSERTKNFIKLTKLMEMVEQEQQKIFFKLNEEEKDEVFEIISKQHNIPKNITVKEVAGILGVTVQMVRRYCVEGKLIAHQRLEGSGKWLIDTKQFMTHKNWGKFVQEQGKIKENSLLLANKMINILDDDSE
ncbi:helix-turn-helix domain-containing protein [Bacillus thuringiensis]|uniref:helix-turn-helix domain-containing protein n=1 Tax=Bacillus thuringiensis TaxID=1428 RepID=UPI0021D6749C|nr:helix-turn-helix domain-containing protein [Bacillus thuringiensis]MCU7667739.1 helix-turn-helix domain-containing protein [Bacillus thuringiensis]